MTTKYPAAFLLLIATSTQVVAERPSINALNTRVNQLEASVNQLESSVNQLSDDLAIINESLRNVTALTNENRFLIDTNARDIGVLNTDMGVLNVTIEKLTSPKRVFITSQTFTGNLGGLEGADAKCQNAADNAALGGEWKAWLSAGNRRDVTIAGRFSRHLGHYIDPTSSLFDLVADPVYGDFPRSLHASISFDEFGNFISSSFNVWTSTSTAKVDSGFPEAKCRGTDGSAWTSESPDRSGHVGSNSSSSIEWQDEGEQQCSQLKHLYCFEQ